MPKRKTTLLTKPKRPAPGEGIRAEFADSYGTPPPLPVKTARWSAVAPVILPCPCVVHACTLGSAAVNATGIECGVASAVCGWCGRESRQVPTGQTGARG
jgi:hypothetical protein